MSLPRPGDVDERELALAQHGRVALRLRRMIDDATATPVYIDYDSAPEWFEAVAQAIEELEEHLHASPVQVLLLAEHALDRLDAAHLDDSDGWLGQAVPRLQRLHATACARAGLRGRALAARLAALAKRSSLEAFHDAADTHAEPLGAAGLSALMQPPST